MIPVAVLGFSSLLLSLSVDFLGYRMNSMLLLVVSFTSVLWTQVGNQLETKLSIKIMLGGDQTPKLRELIGPMSVTDGYITNNPNF